MNNFLLYRFTVFPKVFLVQLYYIFKNRSHTPLYSLLPQSTGPEPDLGETPIPS